jgi:hypothetical protein
MPKRNVESRNSKFMKLRQNQAGQTVNINKIKSKNYAHFKDRVNGAQKSVGYPYAKISTLVNEQGDRTHVLTTKDFSPDRLRYVGKVALMDGDFEYNKIVNLS